MSPLPPLLLRGDCLAQLKRIPDESVHAVVTDPPYGLANTDPAHVVEALTRWAAGERDYIPTGKGFMGKSWDAFVPPPAVWDEVMRILKPGGHLLAFAGSRTFDLMTLSIRFAGFDIRDSIAWLYGSGFPKSMDISKAIDKAAGAEREVIGTRKKKDSYGDATVNTVFGTGPNHGGTQVITGPATDAAREWEGWGTALKPAFEPIVMARKPFVGTVAANVLEYGTGALNIDATRIGSETITSSGSTGMDARRHAHGTRPSDYGGGGNEPSAHVGRWPANVMLDESQAAALDAQAPKTGAAAKASGPSRTGKSTSASRGMFAGNDGVAPFHNDTGGASRFFYVAKAPTRERPQVQGVAHPTVKPLALMRQLLKLVTPPGGCVVDPFAGSGTTMEATYLEGFESIGIELTPEYWPLIEQRIARVIDNGGHDS